MRNARRLAQLCAALIYGLAVNDAQATNGYFASAYSVKSEGVAGTAIALPQDSLTIATNPAGLLDVPDGFDVGADLFRPDRDATLVQGGQAQTFNGDATSSFVIPSIGYLHHLSSTLAAGIAAFGNGGMDTDYAANPFARFGATGSAGVDLEQLFVAPAIAWAVAPRNEVGLAVNLAYQRFSAKGIGIFGDFSTDPAAVSDRGNDNSYGAGVRLGWLGHLTDNLTIGATWQSKTYMSRFTRYAGLFADQGSFDIPSTYGLGLALTPTARWTVALDWQAIRYADVAAVGDPINALFSGVPLGASDGPGFGWRNVSVIKLGTVVKLPENLTLRAGFSDNRQPIPASQTFFNILAPGVVETHATLGLSWSVSAADEISASYLHAFSRSVYGSGSIPPAFGGGEANISLSENSFGLSWSHRL